MNVGGLGKQVGPLPLGVWLLVGGGGLFIAYRKSSGAPAAALATGDPLPTGGGDGSPSSWDGAPVVLSPVVQITPPRITINNTIPTPAPVVIVAPAPIAKPVAPPKVAPKPAPKPVAKKPAPKPAVRTHTVRSGDTLWAIAGGPKWPALYARNAATIEKAARAHGRSNSGGGHWIYPGTVLVLV